MNGPVREGSPLLEAGGAMWGRNAGEHVGLLPKGMGRPDGT